MQEQPFQNDPARRDFRTAVRRKIRACLVLSCGVAMSFLAMPLKAVETVDFNRDIRPILSRNCIALPRPGRKETRGRAAAGRAGNGHRPPRRPSGDRAGRPQAKRTHPPREQRRCRRADAPAIDRQAADRPGDRSALALDPPGGALLAALGLCQAGPAAGAAGRRPRAGPRTTSTASSWPAWKRRNCIRCRRPTATC